MAEMLRAPTEGYAEAIVVPPILAEQFELNHSLINMMTSEQFFGLKKTIHMITFVGAARRWLEKEPPRSITTWEDLVSKFINEFFPPSQTTSLCNEISNFEQKFGESFHETWERYKDLLRACSHHGFTELHQLNTFYNALNPIDQDSLNAAAGGNLLERSTQDVLTIIEDKSKLRLRLLRKLVLPVEVLIRIISVLPPMATLSQNLGTTSKNTLQQPQSTTIREPSYQATAQHNQNFHELERIKKMNDASMKAMQNQIDMVKNELRNEMKNSIQTSLSNQTNEIRNMMASLLQTNTASTSGSGSLPSNTVANPKGEFKAITTRSGLVTDGPTISAPPKFVIPEVGERVKETFMDLDLDEYTIKVPPPLVPKYKPPSQREFVVHQRDPLYPNIPYPSRMLKQKQQEKDEVRYSRALLSNKEKLQELANTPLNENCSAVILKKLPKKLGDPGKFLIPCGFGELKCKALADLGASINLMPLSVWKKLGLPELISTRMTLELANRAICTPAGIARNVFIPVDKFNFSANFVIVDYESDPRVLLILGRPFLRTAHALIDVYGEEVILRDGDERLTLNMKYDTTSYSNHPQRESANLINSFNVSSKHFLKGKDSSLKDLSIQTDLANLDDYFVDPIPEMFTEEHAPDYSSPPKFDVYVDDFLENESYDDNFYDDPFDSEGEKIKESKLLMDKLDLPCGSFPYSESDLFNSLDFSRVDDLPSPNNEDKVFNPRIPIHEKSVTIITHVAQEKKLAISYASLVFKDFEPPFCAPLFFKDVRKSRMLLPFSTENKEKVFKPGIHTSGK
nr:hypothetical protein [Tanacetum cinerariifolium]